MASAALLPEAKSSAEPVRFGQYVVVREVGKGGMACVFEGLHPKLGSRVALKVMNATLAAQPLAAARFLREAKAAARIRHQNVVEVFDVGTEAGIPFIVMEFLEGADLAAMLGETPALPLSGLSSIFLPVISAVASAHDVGIIHRDLKPANVMLTPRPPRGMQPIVLDFGISKILNEDSDIALTRTESVLGTLQYMAPELTKGARFAHPASDQYALGVMLYECATGKRPFTGDNPYDVMHAIVTAAVTPPSRLQSALPPEFDAIVLRAMSRDPAQRFSSVHALGRALISFANRRTWVLWESEFVDTPDSAREACHWESSTLDDSQSASRRSRAQKPKRRVHDWLSPRWLLALLTLYAFFASLWLARLGSQKATVVNSIATTLSPEPGNALADASKERTEARLETEENAPVRPRVEEAPQPTPVPAPRKRQASLPPVTANEANKEVPPPAPTSSARMSTQQVGTNGAPIID